MNAKQRRKRVRKIVADIHRLVSQVDVNELYGIDRVFTGSSFMLPAIAGQTIDMSLMLDLTHTLYQNEKGKL